VGCQIQDGDATPLPGFPDLRILKDLETVHLDLHILMELQTRLTKVTKAEDNAAGRASRRKITLRKSTGNVYALLSREFTFLVND